VREITNAQFRQFSSDHRYGFAGLRLSSSIVSVVSVTCRTLAPTRNWLSKRTKLDTGYESKARCCWSPWSQANERLRIPTEAAWDLHRAQRGGHLRK
jgi:hypothetical protein